VQSLHQVVTDWLRVRRVLSGVLRVCPEMARPSTPPPSTSAPGGEGTSKGDMARSAPLPKDVLGIAVLDEERVVAVLGVSLALSVLLEDYTEPGWLPAAIDEEHVPLNGLFAQLPSFCFTENYRGVVPIRVVRQFPNHAPSNTRSCSPPPHLSPSPPPANTPGPTIADAPVRITPRPAPPHARRGAGHGICFGRERVEELPHDDAGELGPSDAAGRLLHRMQDVEG